MALQEDKTGKEKKGKDQIEKLIKKNWLVIQVSEG